MQLANNIKALRVKQKLTQDEFGHLFDVTRSTVSKWERGLSIPELSTLNKIAVFFDVTIEELTTSKDITKTKEERLLNAAKANVNKTRAINHNILFVVPFLNIILVTLIMISLLAVLVPTYNDNKNQNNEFNLVYSNIESVSLKILYPNNENFSIYFKKKIIIHKTEYYIKNVFINCDEKNEFGLENFASFYILIHLKNKYSIDVVRENKLIIINDFNTEYMVLDQFYPHIVMSGYYDMTIYFKSETAYLGVYLSS